MFFEHQSSARLEIGFVFLQNIPGGIKVIKLLNSTTFMKNKASGKNVR